MSIRQSRHFVRTFILVSTGVYAAQSLADEASKKRFLTEAPAAWSRYRDFATKLQGTCTTRMIRDTTEVLATANEIKQRMGSRLFIVEYKSGEAASKQPAGTVYGLNDNYGFTLRRVHEGDPWFVAKLERVAATDRKSTARSGVNRVDGLACTVLALTNGRFVDELLSQPTFELVDVTEADGLGGREVRVQFDNRHSPDEGAFFAVQGGAIVFDPEQSWCVRSSELRCEYTNGRELTNVAVDYERRPDGFPMPLKLHEESHGTTSGEKDSQPYRTSWDVALQLSVPAELPPESDFYLSAFGLPEPGQQHRDRLPWLLLLAAMLIVAGIAIRRRAARRKPPHSDRAGDVPD